MGGDAWWVRSPIIVLPLAAFVLGLALVPFGIGSADHAAEFYGAFLAAIVAALAALSGFFIQAELSNRREDAKKRQAEDRDAILILSYVRYITAQLRRASIILTATTYPQAVGAGDPRDLAATKAVTLRHLIPEVEPLSFREFMEAARSYAPDLGLLAAAKSFEAVAEKASYRFLLIPDNNSPNRSNIEGAVRVLNIRVGDLQQISDAMQAALHARNVI